MQVHKEEESLDKFETPAANRKDKQANGEFNIDSSSSNPKFSSRKQLHRQSIESERIEIMDEHESNCLGANHKSKQEKGEQNQINSPSYEQQDASQQIYRILHQDNFKVEKVLTNSSQASIFLGKVRNFDNIIEKDLPYIRDTVLLKQFQLKKERKGFKRELKILKKIKSLDLPNNGGFPVIISAKLSNTLGEILMSYCGPDLFQHLNIQKSLEDKSNHQNISLQQLSDIGMQIVSQLEIIHKLGFTHGDLKFQNLCYNAKTQQYSIIDFALVSKIFHKNGQHKKQEKMKTFYGNSLFASESMINYLSTSRKDDLESLMYILCFLNKGTLPIIDYINENIDNFHMSMFLQKILLYRQEKKIDCQEKLKNLMADQVKSAYGYVMQLNHEDKPNYDLIRLWLAFSEEDEQRAFNSKLKINNKKLARDILYDDSAQSMKLVPKSDEERKAKEQRELEMKEKVKNAEDLKDNYKFDIDVNEFQTHENEIQIPNKNEPREIIIKRKEIIENIQKGTPSVIKEPDDDKSKKSRNDHMSVSSDNSVSDINQSQIIDSKFVDQLQPVVSSNRSKAIPSLSGMGDASYLLMQKMRSKKNQVYQKLVEEGGSLPDQADAVVQDEPPQKEKGQIKKKKNAYDPRLQ